MSPVNAMLVALLIYALGLAPFIWMAVRSGGARWAAGLSGALILAIALGQTGLFHRESLASADVARFAGAGATAGRCQQVFDVLREGGVVLEAPGARSIIVRGAAWDQLAPPVRDAVLACVPEVSGATDESDDEEIEVIRR
jgi:hypothetical protein